MLRLIKYLTLRKKKLKTLHLQTMASLRQIAVSFDPSNAIKMTRKLSTAFTLIILTLEANFLQAKQNEIEIQMASGFSGRSFINLTFKKLMQISIYACEA